MGNFEEQLKTYKHFNGDYAALHKLMDAPTETIILVVSEMHKDSRKWMEHIIEYYKEGILNADYSRLHIKIGNVRFVFVSSSNIHHIEGCPRSTLWINGYALLAYVIMGREQHGKS